MTKKDYVLIAEAMRNVDYLLSNRNTFSFDVFPVICNIVANSLSSNNPRFDRNKFLTACGVKEL